MKLFHRCLPFRLSVLAAASAILYSGHALAIEPFTVKDIRVEGIQRTEAGTVFNYLPVRVGDTFSDEKAASVSYTHLDVYKRQLSDRCRTCHPRRGTSFFFSVIQAWF